MKHGLFSYDESMQRLIARGEEGLSYTDPTVSGLVRADMLTGIGLTP